MLKGEYDGVIIATLFGSYVEDLSLKLDEKEIPYIYIDSDIVGQNNLAYFGGDSFVSGQIAAKLLVQEVGLQSDIFFTHIRFKHDEISVQMKTREQGFMDYLVQNQYKGKVHHIELNPDDRVQCVNILTNLFKNSKGALIGGIVLNSRIYELMDFLTNIDEVLKKNVRLVGHDAIEGNIKALKNDQVSFLLSQRPDLQGYDAVKALGNYFLFKQTPEKKNYMPIDILLKENIDYYNNYKL